MLLVQISTILKMTMTESCSEEQNVFSFFFTHTGKSESKSI